MVIKLKSLFLTTLFFVTTATLYTQNITVTANNDIIKVYKAHTSEANILNNDYGISDGVSGLKIVSQPENGYAYITDDNRAGYIPDPYFTGLDEFTYEVCNNYGSCDIATVFTEVMDYDFKPIASNDTIQIFNITSLKADVLDNDDNLYDIPIVLTIIENFNYSTATVTENLQIEFAINTYFTGTDSLKYRVCDKDNDCDEAWLFVIMGEQESDREDIFVPGGFSPDGDGINDTFYIPELRHVQNISITIVDRNGFTVYKSNSFSEWDGYANHGSYSGDLLPAGIYYYNIKVEGLNESLKGYIYLSR
ncbi:gliding motility-associated C-terminal domain-containing protein [Marinilabiliaceae bacterium ANBcel2]|nr:gliding motility-associated C-terminal domain-containing protein [Marinilabiliaceae bacterium ANBcel2]